MNDTFGQELRQVRQARKLSLEDVAKATYIRLHHLQAMEAGNFEAFSSLAQARGFLRTYADFLGLNPQPLLERLGGSRSTRRPAEQPPQAAMHVPLHAIQKIPSTQEQRPPPPAPETNAASKVHFVQIGQQLCQRREILGLSLEEIEAHTHVRMHYLQALEEGDLDLLPSSVQGRGMLKNYANFLGMDPDPLLLGFADGLQARFLAGQPQRIQAQRSQPSSQPPAAPIRPASTTHRVSMGELLWGVTLLLVLIGFVGWGAFRVFTTRSTEAKKIVPTPPPIADVLLSTPSGVVLLASSSPTLTPTQSILPTITPLVPDVTTLVDVTGDATLPAAEIGKIHVNIAVRQRAWMRVTVDGQVAFEGRVLPGSAYPFSGENRIEVVTGNGSGLQVYYNQQDLGPLGFAGEVVDRIFTGEGVQTPTATVTSSSTLGAPVTPTPTRKP
jgi:cytoskeletal protein RodZ